MAALKLITSGVSFFSHALMAARKRDDVQSYTDASHFTEEMSCQLLPQRGSCDDLRLALGARAFPPTREEGCLRLALGARAFPTRGKGRIRVGTEAVLRTNEISPDVLLSTKKPEATRVNETT